MLIIGTGGFASDILSSMQYDIDESSICFYNDTDEPPRSYIKQFYRVITSLDEARDYLLGIDSRFVVGVGDNVARKQLSEKFQMLGGKNTSYVSVKAMVGKHVDIADKGAIVMHHAVIGNGSAVGEGSVIYCNASLGHSSIIGNYSLVSGNVCMSNTRIGDFSMIGIGVNFKPGVSVGDYCFIGVGSVVNKDVESHTIAYGNPAREVKKNVVSDSK